jgi:hypothetical protein
MALVTNEQLEMFHAKRIELRDSFYREAIDYIDSRQMGFRSPVAVAMLGNCEKKLTAAAMEAAGIKVE